MKLSLLRYDSGPKATLGTLAVNGSFQCYTLEDVVRETSEPVEKWKVPGKTAIPRGTYRVVIDFSNRFGKPLPHVLDVPGYTGVRIHPGNTSEDTEGCILVGGKPTGPDFIPNSRQTFNKLFSMLEQAEQDGQTISIEVK